MRPSSLVALAAALLLTAVVARADDGQEELERDIELLVKQQGSAGTQVAPSAADLKTMAMEIVDDLATVRQLPRKGKLAMEVATREQIVAYVESRLAEELKVDELAGQEAALKRLGLIPESMDMKKFLLDLYGEQVAGYYDPFKSKLFIASWLPEAIQVPTMAHELTHALQDQHFNLKPVLTPFPENSDATSARHSVVEGDAVLAMFAYIEGKSGAKMSKENLGQLLRSSMKSGSYPIFESAPAYFQEGLLFLYADGTEFAAAVHAKGGWPALSNVYKSFPASTEQILHPEKYLGPAKDAPTAIPLKLELKGWKEVHSDVLGESIVNVMMRGFLDEATATRISEGWDGDRYRAFHKGTGRPGVRGTLVVHRSTWDSVADAKEFAEGWKSITPKKYPGAIEMVGTDLKGALAGYKTVEDGFVRIELKEKDVVVVDGAPDLEAAENLAKLAWK